MRLSAAVGAKKLRGWGAAERRNPIRGNDPSARMALENARGAPADPDSGALRGASQSSAIANLCAFIHQERSLDVRHGLGRKDSSPVLRARRIARGLALFVLAAVPLLAAGRMIWAQDDPRDLIEERRRDVQRERRVVQQDLNRERRLDDREYGRPDPQALERRTKLYRDLKKDFIDFDKNGFDRGPDRRYRGGEPSAVVESPETLDLVRRIFARIAEEADALQVGLNNDVDQIRGVRSVLHDVIEFSARAQVLAESCRRADRVGVLYGDFEAFDRDWQAISYKLRRIPDLNQS